MRCSLKNCQALEIRCIDEAYVRSERSDQYLFPRVRPFGVLWCWTIVRRDLKTVLAIRAEVLTFHMQLCKDFRKLLHVWILFVNQA